MRQSASLRGSRKTQHPELLSLSPTLFREGWTGFAGPLFRVRPFGSGCGRASCAGGTVTTLAIRPLPGAVRWRRVRAVSRPSAVRKTIALLSGGQVVSALSANNPPPGKHVRTAFVEDTMESTTQQPRVLHSPGPYRYHFDRDGCDDFWVIVDRNSKSVARIVFWDCCEDWACRAEANAILLAAAPELLEMLKGFMAEIQRLPAEVLTERLLELRRRGTTMTYLIEEGVTPEPIHEFL